MEWPQFVVFFIGVFGLFIWNRSEARSDARHMENQVKANRDLIYDIHTENAQLMRDFHGRLCSIEEKIKKESKDTVIL